MANNRRIDEIISKRENSDEAGIYQKLRKISDLETFYSGIFKLEFTEDDNTRRIIIENTNAIYEAALYPAVGLVACIENFFRIKVKQLVDSSSFYKQNAAKLQVKIDLKTTIDLEVNNLSLGEFVAHVVKLNNLKDINSTLSELLGEDFMKLLSHWRDKLDIQLDLFDGTEQEVTSKDKFDWLMKTLDDLYTKRNKICHEAQTSGGDNYEVEFLCFSKHVIEFISVTDEMLASHVKTNK